MPVTEPSTRRVYQNVIYTDGQPWYCAGSGGVGGAKTFWTPYSTENPELREKVAKDDLCDNCKTMTHENQHGIGSDVEFDSFSDHVSKVFRAQNFPPGERLEDRVGLLFIHNARDCQKGFNDRFGRGNRNQLCALNERLGTDKLRELARADNISDADIDRVLECACGQI